jgi:hypothetical protein
VATSNDVQLTLAVSRSSHARTARRSSRIGMPVAARARKPRGDSAMGDSGFNPKSLTKYLVGIVQTGNGLPRLPIIAAG